MQKQNRSRRCLEEAVPKRETKASILERMAVLGVNPTISRPQRAGSLRSMPIKIQEGKDSPNWARGRDICYCSPIMTIWTSPTSTRTTLRRPGSSFITSGQRAKTHCFSKSSIRLFSEIAQTRLEAMNYSAISTRPYTRWPSKPDTMCVSPRNVRPLGGPSTSNSEIILAPIRQAVACYNSIDHHTSRTQNHQQTDPRKWHSTSCCKKRCATTLKLSKRSRSPCNAWCSSMSKASVEYLCDTLKRIYSTTKWLKATRRRWGNTCRIPCSKDSSIRICEWYLWKYCLIKLVIYY